MIRNLLDRACFLPGRKIHLPPAKPIVPGQFRRHARKLAQRFAPALTGKELQELAYGDSNKTLWNLIRHKRPDLAFRYLYAMRPAGSGHNYSDTLIFLKQILIPALESTAYQNQDLEHLIDAYQNHFHCKIAVDLLSHIHTREMSEETREKLIALEPIIGERMTQDAFDKYIERKFGELAKSISDSFWIMDAMQQLSAKGEADYERFKNSALKGFTAVINQVTERDWLKPHLIDFIQLPANDFEEVLAHRLESLGEPELEQKIHSAKTLLIALHGTVEPRAIFAPNYYAQYADACGATTDDCDFVLKIVLDDLTRNLQQSSADQLTVSRKQGDEEPSLHERKSTVDHRGFLNLKNRLTYLIPKTSDIKLLSRIETIVDDPFHGPWFTQTGQPDPEDPDVNFLKKQIWDRREELDSSL